MLPKVHHLKTDLIPFKAVWDGDKLAEFRKDDGRDFRVGDNLVLMEWDSDKLNFTDRVCIATITHTQEGYGIPAGYVMLSMCRWLKGCIGDKRVDRFADLPKQEDVSKDKAHELSFGEAMVEVVEGRVVTRMPANGTRIYLRLDDCSEVEWGFCDSVGKMVWNTDPLHIDDLTATDYTVVDL